MNSGTKNPGPNKSSPLSASGVLPKAITIFIGRGGCCYGHIIAIDKNGNLEYFVGTYAAPTPNPSEVGAYLPETFDQNFVEVDNKYAKKKKLIPPEVLKRLEQLIGDEEKLSFRDKSLVYDDYVYNIYLDNSGIAYGHESKIKNFPTNLQEFIKLIGSQVELYKLPGMA
jgi:hypothetical protein